MRVSVVGSGYVGLITAVGLASKGHQVVCIDVDRHKVDMINRGVPPFHEDKLEERLHEHVIEQGNLKATLDYDELLDSEVAFICVNTCSRSGRNTDFTNLRDSTRRIGEILKRKDGYLTVVTKSSVVPGTTEEVIIPSLQEHSGKAAGRDFGMAVNPEFLQEGRALDCFLNSDRIIVGQYDQRSGDIVQNVYNGAVPPLLRTGLRTAEMIKFASNAFLATKISFINEIGNLCKKLGIDVYQVADGMGHDPRIGRLFLNAGIGFGGSCLPKDLEALLHKYEQVDERSPILSAVYQVNKAQPVRMIEIVRRRLGELKGKNMAVLGLAFKAGTDDIRNSPAVEVIGELLRQGAGVTAYDPMVVSKMQAIFPEGVTYGLSARDTVEAADCILILTDWAEFKDESLYSGKVVIDGRRVLDPERARAVCQCYEGVCW